jgi:uncharacterized protein (TIGR02145 family)/uncharacterized repeat protein (TIGR02543 family)
MGKKYTFGFLCSVLFCTFSCYDRSNPFDEGGSNYIPPKITINEEASSVKNQDTVHFDSVTIVVAGNREQSRFNLKVDNRYWMTNWEPEGTFGFGELPDGKHTVHINSMYRGGELVVSNSITFYVLTKGYKPEFKNENDTVITLFEGKPVILSAHAEGNSILAYSWLKGKSVLEGKNTETLKFDAFSSSDTASFKCIVSNEYGKDTSRTFILKYRPFSGEIKGVVTDTSGNKLENALIFLSPSIKKDTTASDGSFTFSSLSENTYTLKISLVDYLDTILSDIIVNDSETVDLQTIKLKIIDTTTYKVVYNGNGNDSGTVPVDSNSFIKGKEVTVAGNPGNLYREGHSFSGWNTKADGTGEMYNAGAKFAMPDSAVTLYVKWTTNPTYSIVYHSAISTGGDVPETVNADSGMQVSIADSGSLYKTGYTFVGWNTKEDGSGKAYKTGDKVVIGTVNIDLYAQWAKAQYTVTYHGNGSTGGTVPPKTTHLYQTEIVIASSGGDLEKTGHSFIGWNTDSAGNGLDYQSGNKIIIDKNIHLFARWIKKKYQIIFSGNGERTSNIPDATEVEYGAKIDSSSFIISRESYVFDGWFKDSLCVAKWKYELDSVTSNDTLYAKWVIKDINSNIYTEVKIGNQVWMVENLKATRYNDSALIPYIMTASAWTSLYSCENNPCIYKPGYCWYNNDSATNSIYGALYNWAVIGTYKLAPVGWHVPSDSEFIALAQYLNNGSVDVAGGKLKEAGTTHWNAPNEGATDSVGFRALPGGFRNHDGNGTFDGIGNVGYWWLSTQVTMGSSMYFSMTNDRVGLSNNYSSKSSGYSVRCIRDY